MSGRGTKAGRSLRGLGTRFGGSIAAKLYCFAFLALLAVASLSIASIYFSRTTENAARHLYGDSFLGVLSSARLELLADGVRTVLIEAIEAGGSTLRDFRDAEGGSGYFQHRFDVYDRENDPCHTPGCTGTVKRIVQSGRSTFYCPVCQR